MGLPADLVFRTKGQLAADICTEAFADGIRLDYPRGDEVYGSCTGLREFLEGRGQGYVLRVASSVRLALAAGITLTRADAAARLLTGARRWEVRSAGDRLQGGRALLRLGPARHRRPPPPAADPPPPPHRRAGLSLLLHTRGPAGHRDPAGPRAAGLRWPAEEDFGSGKDCLGLDQSQVRLYAAIARHTALVMAAVAICAVTAALLRDRTDTQAPAPTRPGQLPPADPGAWSR